MNNPKFVSLKSGVGFCSTAVLFAILLTGTSLFAADDELELQRSDDLLEWKSLAIRPEMLTKEGRIRQSREGDIGFFRQQIAESKRTEISEQHRAEILHIIDSALEENEIPGILFGIKYRGEEPIV